MNGINEIISFLADYTGMLMGEDAKLKIGETVSRWIQAASKGKGSPAGYLDLLRSPGGAGELESLIDGLSVGETYFFRNAPHWRAFKEYVLPLISERAVAENRKMRFWSAGCASGEEPYTLAVYLREERMILHEDVEIFATDISGEALKKSDRGYFGKNSFRAEKPMFVKKYFSLKNGKYELSKEIRRMVEFRRLNLAMKADFPELFSGMDTIFCRNVLMYLQPERAGIIISRFADCLREGGFLFLGHAESALADKRLFRTLQYKDTFLFQKAMPAKEDVNSAQVVLPQDTRVSRSSKKRSSSQKRHFPPETFKSGRALTKEKTIPAKAEKKSPADRYRQALDHYIAEDFARALEALSKHGSDNDRSLEELILQGLVHMNMSNPDRALSYCRKAMKKSDVEPEVHLLHAMIMEVQSDYGEAASAARKAIFLDGGFFAAHFRLGHILFSTGETSGARRSFSDALRALPGDTEERVQLFCGKVSKNLLAEVCERRCRS